MLALGYAIEHTAKMAFFAIRAKQAFAFLRGCADGLRGLPALKRECLDPHSLRARACDESTAGCVRRQNPEASSRKDFVIVSKGNARAGAFL